MARPRKLAEGETEIMTDEYLPPIKTLVQPYATTLTSEGRPAYEADAKVAEWIAKGYRLFAAHPYAASNDVIQVWFLLVRE